MKSAKYKKHGIINIEHTWFAENITSGAADVCFFHEIQKTNVPDDKRYIKEREYNTAITDLTKTEEELWNLIKKNTRYEIRRAGKEGIKEISFLADELPDDMLVAFEKTYNNMYISKGMKNTFNKELVKSYMKSAMIWFSIALFEEEPLVFHSYIVDSIHARFFYSCSPFREQKEIATRIGMMNRYLHWSDMMQLKQMGVEKYDWGGISNFDMPNSIDRFKLSFGGERKMFYNYIVANTRLGKMVLRFL